MIRRLLIGSAAVAFLVSGVVIAAEAKASTNAKPAASSAAPATAPAAESTGKKKGHPCFVCGDSKIYHTDANCANLKKCGNPAKEITRKEAKEGKLEQCKTCAAAAEAKKKE